MKENDNNNDNNNNDNDEMTEDEKLMNRVLEIPLGKHVDTGILTCKICSGTSGLEILNRNNNEYFDSEKLYTPIKHMFVTPGRKMELFSYHKRIPACWHRVKIPVTGTIHLIIRFT